MFGHTTLVRVRDRSTFKGYVVERGSQYCNGVDLPRNVKLGFGLRSWLMLGFRLKFRFRFIELEARRLKIEKLSKHWYNKQCNTRQEMK